MSANQWLAIISVLASLVLVWFGSRLGALPFERKARMGLVWAVILVVLVLVIRFLGG